MIGLSVLFACAVTAYAVLTAVDASLTGKLISSGLYVEHEAMATKRGHLAMRRFARWEFIWLAVMALSFSAGIMTGSAWPHSIWLGVAGVLLTRSIVTVLHNRSLVRRLP